AVPRTTTTPYQPARRPALPLCRPSCRVRSAGPAARRLRQRGWLCESCARVSDRRSAEVRDRQIRLPLPADVTPVCGELLISPESAIRHTQARIFKCSYMTRLPRMRATAFRPRYLLAALGTSWPLYGVCG